MKKSFLIPAIVLYVVRVAFSNSVQVGTVLFTTTDLVRRCWSDYDKSLLRARAIMQDVLPDPDCLDFSNPESIVILLDYFHTCYKIISISTYGKVQRLLFTALSDAFGGYLRAHVLPYTRKSYYAGIVKYSEAQKLFLLYDDIKSFLKTDGRGWPPPTKAPLRNFKVKPLVITSGAEEACNLLFIIERDRKRHHKSRKGRNCSKRNELKSSQLRRRVQRQINSYNGTLISSQNHLKNLFPQAEDINEKEDIPRFGCRKKNRKAPPTDLKGGICLGGPCRREGLKEGDCREQSRKVQVCREAVSKEEASREEARKEEARKHEDLKEEPLTEDPSDEDLCKTEECQKEEDHEEDFSIEDLFRDESRKEEEREEDPCKEVARKEERRKEDPGKEEASKKKEQMEDVCPEELYKKETDKQKHQKEDPCKEEQKDDPCKEEQKEDPCKEEKKEDPCKEEQKEDPCKEEQKEDPCKEEQKEDPCKEEQKEDPCKKEQKEDPCKKEQKEDPCKEVARKEERRKEDPGKKDASKKKDQKEDLCPEELYRKETDKHKPQKEDPCEEDPGRKETTKEETLKEESSRQSHLKEDLRKGQQPTEKEPKNQHPCKDILNVYSSTKKSSKEYKLEEDPRKEYSTAEEPCTEFTLQEDSPKEDSSTIKPSKEYKLQENAPKEFTLQEDDRREFTLQDARKEFTLQEDPRKEFILQEDPRKEFTLEEDPRKEFILQEDPRKERSSTENLLTEYYLEEDSPKAYYSTIKPSKEYKLQEDLSKERSSTENEQKEFFFQEEISTDYPSETETYHKEFFFQEEISTDFSGRTEYPPTEYPQTENPCKEFTFENVFSKEEPRQEFFMEEVRTEAAPTDECDKEEELIGKETLEELPGDGENPAEETPKKKCRKHKARKRKHRKHKCRKKKHRNREGEAQESGCKKTVIVPLPVLDDCDCPTSIALPFRNRPFRNLKAPSSAFVLENYYITVIKCFIAKGNRRSDIKDFNGQFQRWLTSKVVPLLGEEQWYPGFGGVLRVLETIKVFGTDKSYKGKECEDYGYLFEEGAEFSVDSSFAWKGTYKPPDMCDVAKGTDFLRRYMLAFIAVLSVAVLSLLCCCLYYCHSRGRRTTLAEEQQGAVYQSVHSHYADRNLSADRRSSNLYHDVKKDPNAPQCVSTYDNPKTKQGEIWSYGDTRGMQQHQQQEAHFFTKQSAFPTEPRLLHNVHTLWKKPSNLMNRYWTSDETKCYKTEVRTMTCNCTESCHCTPLTDSSALTKEKTRKSSTVTFFEADDDVTHPRQNTSTRSSTQYSTTESGSEDFSSSEYSESSKSLRKHKNSTHYP